MQRPPLLNVMAVEEPLGWSLDRSASRRVPVMPPPLTTTRIPLPPVFAGVRKTSFDEALIVKPVEAVRLIESVAVAPELMLITILSTETVIEFRENGKPVVMLGWLIAAESKTTSSVEVGTAPSFQFDAVAQAVLVYPLHDRVALYDWLIAETNSKTIAAATVSRV